MLPTPPDNLIWGWVSTPNQRGTIDILWGNLATTWLCTWTCLCLNIPPPGKRRGWHAIMYKFRWQLFAIFFPEVLVVTALEQWLSAYQSVRMFHQLGHRQWTTRHGFFADMGGIMVAPRDFPPFPVDSQQLAYLVRNKYLTLPDITVDEIKALNKADGLARLVTIIQMTWFCVSFVARGATGLGYSTLEVTTLAFILCTLHTYTLWYCKPLDPQTQRVISIDADIRQICQQPGVDTAAWLSSYPRTPLDFVKSHANSKSPTIPFWYGLSVVFFYSQRAKRKPAQTLPNSILTYYGLYIGFAWLASFPSRTEFYLWLIACCADLVLIAIYEVLILIGGHNSRTLGLYFFDQEAESIPELADMLPLWLKLVLHAPFVFAYVAARAIVLAESLASLRALPPSVYQDVNWPNFIPHV